MDTRNPTINPRPGQGIDMAILEPLLRAQITGLGDFQGVTQYPSGKSNLTYRLAFAGKPLVLRRPPPGTKAKSAHDMGREFKVQKGLKPGFPFVPEVLYHCSDTSVLGEPFYVMAEVPGYLVHDAFPAEWGWREPEVRRFCQRFWDRLIELHQLPFEPLGLGDLGRPDGYVARQIGGWNRRFERARTPDAPDAQDVMAWLEAEMPSDVEPTIIHNDYRIDNVILAPDDPHDIVAILDWEMATLGHPLMDLGNSLAYWTEAGDDAGSRLAASQPSDLSGMLSRAEVVRYYADQTGRNVDDFPYYLIYGYFRLAVIIQQIYYRYYHGETQDERFAGWVSEVDRLVQRCRDLIRGVASV